MNKFLGINLLRSTKKNKEEVEKRDILNLRNGSSPQFQKFQVNIPSVDGGMLYKNIKHPLNSFFPSCKVESHSKSVSMYGQDGFNVYEIHFRFDVNKFRFKWVDFILLTHKNQIELHIKPLIDIMACMYNL